MVRTVCLSAVVVALVGSAVPLIAAEVPEKPRNPFNLPDIPDPDGADVQALAARFSPKADPNDPNATQWVEKVTTAQPGSIDGEWRDRWRLGGQSDWVASGGTVEIKSLNDRVYILAHSASGRYLVDLKRTGNRLAGRYKNQDNPIDTGPCAFLVVDEERIDGCWYGPAARWDFRRRLK